MAQNPKQRKRLFWILLGVLVYFLMRLANRHTWLAEEVYGGFIYPAIRGMFRYTFGLLPFPSIYLVILLVLVLFYRTAIRPLIKRELTVASVMLGVLSTASAVFALFYILWGFNYARPGVIERLDMLAMPLDSTQLQEEFEYATEELLSWTIKHEVAIRKDLDAFTSVDEIVLAKQIKAIVEPMGYMHVPRPRGRELLPKGILMRFSTAGIYIPFCGEGHVDAGMLPLQIPFTMAHELSHGYGVTNEGECNFLAYLACNKASDPLIRYSGLLSYWRYVASDYRRAFPDTYSERYDQLPRLVKESIEAIRENNRKYPDILPALRDKVYDTYLKSNGIDDGLVSYNTVVRMVHAHRLKKGSAFQ